MTDEEIIKQVQEQADLELSQMPTFSEDMAEKIKKECLRLVKEREEWLKSFSDKKE